MDFAPILRMVIDFWIDMLSREFTFAGYTTTVGAVVVWCALATLVIGIMRRLS